MSEKEYHKVSIGKCKKKNSIVRDIEVASGVKASYDYETKDIVAYLFDKDTYTLSKSKEWVTSHKDKAIHQALVDIDYVINKRQDLNQLYRKATMDKIVAKN